MSILENPAMPVPGEDPWWSKLQSVVNSLQSKGHMTETVDLDTIRTRATRGPFSSRSSRLINGPNIPVDMSVSVEVFWHATNIVMQRITGSSGQMWWRAANSDTTWSPWQTVPLAPVISQDPSTPIQDGGVLFVVDPSHVQTIFPSDPIGTEFSTLWDTGIVAWRSVNGRGELNAADGNKRGGVTWNKFDNVDDVEVTVIFEPRVFYNTTSYGTGPIVRASGDTATRTGIIAGLYKPASGSLTLVLWEFVNAATKVLGTVEVASASTPPAVVKLRAEGDKVHVKAWPVGTMEPSEWNISATTTVEDPGKTGLYARGAMGSFKMMEAEKL